MDEKRTYENDPLHPERRVVPELPEHGVPDSEYERRQTVTERGYVEREPTFERSRRESSFTESVRAPSKVSWGAIFAGTFVTLGAWLLLYSLGLALGLTSVNPSNPDSLRSAGIGAGIFGLIAPLIALFAGGLVASRVAGVGDRVAGSIHGAVVWSLTVLAGVYLAFSLIGGVASGVVNVGGKAISAGAQGAVAAVQGAGGISLSSLGITEQDLLGPVNQRLQAEGKPTVTMPQIEAATKDVMSTAVREGGLNRNQLVSSIAANTNLSRADATDIANRLETKFNEQKSQLGQSVSQMAQNVQTGALQAAETTGKVFWGVFFALLLGLGAAVFGANLGVKGSEKHRHKVRREEHREYRRDQPVHS